MKQILIASDISDRSRRALKRAVCLSRRFQARLSVLNVVDSDLPAQLVREEVPLAKQVLEETVLEQFGVGEEPRPEIAVLTGDPFDVISREAERIGADLIVMGSHRKQLLRDIFTGTTIERVMRASRIPVLMVNRDSADDYANVLAAIDLSEASAQALKAAAKLGLLVPARDGIVHATMPLAEGMMYYTGIDRNRIGENIEEFEAKVRSGITGFLRGAGFGEMASFMLIESGAPFEAIERGVQRFDADLLVIGTRGQDALNRMLIGSVADEVLRKVECDVLAVPQLLQS